MDYRRKTYKIYLHCSRWSPGSVTYHIYNPYTMVLILRNTATNGTTVIQRDVCPTYILSKLRDGFYRPISHPRHIEDARTLDAAIGPPSI